MTALLKTHTLGCKVNQYETQYLRECLLDIGYAEAESEQPADLCIVNTCTVTAEGDRKSRQIIRRLNRQNPGARIVVMGCYATREPGAVARLPGVSDVITNKRELPDLLGRFGVADIPSGISGMSGRHRAWVKVQDGCLLRCSYCIIPHVRPDMYSRSPADILDEVQRLAGRGYREIVLTGIHLGHYGVDFNRNKPKTDWIRLAGLVREICQQVPEIRVRLSSIEATEVTGELIEVMAEYPDRLCPHLHVCLQSGSDPVLRRMRRRWSVRQIIDRCLRVRDRLDNPALTTDVIVGFPGETDTDFEATLAACRTIGFSKIHMFPFSARRGTAAAEMPDQVDPEIRIQRGEAVRQCETELRSRYASSLLGQRLDVLVENLQPGDGLAGGTACRYLPVDIDYRGHSADFPATTGSVVSVQAVATTATGLLARPSSDQSSGQEQSGNPLTRWH